MRKIQIFEEWNYPEVETREDNTERENHALNLSNKICRILGPYEKIRYRNSVNQIINNYFDKNNLG